jgi:ABC-2 type transport system permease protein
MTTGGRVTGPRTSSAPAASGQSDAGWPVASAHSTRNWPLGELLRHSGLLTARSVRSLLRQPAYAAITLVQPVIWLLLFGQLFRSVVHIPGFHADNGSYLEFITPGVILMTALFSSGWAGTVYIEDMDRGVMDRLLASPVRRGAMMIGSLAYQALTTALQTLIVFAIAYAAGARFAGGVVGIAITLLAAVLMAMVIASLSNAIALLVRRQEALIGISQFIVLPLQFLSSAIMDTRLSPGWVRHVARYNPVDWAVVASRQALSSGTQWGTVLPRLGFLVLLAAAMAWLATRAFRAYQRSA